MLIVWSANAYDEPNPVLAFGIPAVKYETASRSAYPLYCVLMVAPLVLR